MRVSRVQAEENRRTVIDESSRLFREHGFDGIGLKDLMKAAGLTQGAFYKQFDSKDDLAAEASKRALESASSRWSTAADKHPDDPLRAVIDFYLSTGHRDERADGCPVVALGSDAARQGPDVKAAFEEGIKHYLELVEGWIDMPEKKEAREKAAVVLSTMAGALLLSRAVNDKKLSKWLLQVAAKNALAMASNDDGD